MNDPELRLAAFDWLAQQADLHGDVLPWALLALGFEYHGERIPLVSQQGIFKPKSLEIPLSIRTSAGGPYDDSFGPDGLVRYRYRGTDPDHRDNVGLREAMRQHIPMAYFHGIAKGRYLSIWPVYIVGDDPTGLTFRVAVDDAELGSSLLASQGDVAEHSEYDSDSRRRYVTALVRRRLHQRTFREKVLRAYRKQCAFCRLQHPELLDAAHIIPDTEELGEPKVPNGVSLCKLHHAAFDAFFLTIRPDYLVEVRGDILKESDGPMLLHGLQEIDGLRIQLPRKPADRPSEELLIRRYEQYTASITS